MKGKHATAGALVLAGLGQRLMGLTDWHAVLTTSFIGGLLVALGALVAALSTEKVQKE